jgi:hypothetical protein
MSYVKITNGQPENYSIGQLRRDNPNTSFPKRPSDELLADWDVFPLTPTPRPEVDYTKNVTEGAAVLTDGAWTQVWDVTDATPDEIAQRTDNEGQSVRSQRDYLLQQTDWMALSDNTMTPEWAAYRQSLRDVTDQAGFPWSITWPTKP